MEESVRSLFVNDPSVKSGRLTNFKKLLPKLLFIIFGIIIIIEIIFSVRKLIAKDNLANNSSRPGATLGGIILLLTQNKSVKVGEEVNVNIGITSGKYNIYGADVLFSYDPTILAPSTPSFEKGAGFSDYPVIEIKDGNVRISAIGNPGKDKGVLGKFGVVHFKAISSGRTSLKVNFTPGSTTDSNITDSDSNKDIIEKVVNLDIEVK